METKANYALIGSFTLAVILAAFGFVYWFASASSSSARYTVEVVFTGSVSGLTPGAQVLFNGLKVGEVKEIKLSPDNPQNVAAFITIDSSTPLRADTTARLEYQGLTGAAQISLTGGSNEAGSVPFVSGHDYQIIYAEKSDMQDIVETVRAVARKADEVLLSVEKIVNNSEIPITNTMKDIEKFAHALGDNSEGLDTFLEQISAVATKIGPLAERLDKLAGNLDDIVAGINKDSVKNIVGNVEELTAKVNKAADNLDSIVNGVEGFFGSASGKEGAGAFTNIKEAAHSLRILADNLNDRVNQIAPGMAQFSGSGLRDYQSLASEARQTLAEFNRVLRNVDRNPQQFLFGGKPSVPAYNGRR